MRILENLISALCVCLLVSTAHAAPIAYSGDATKIPVSRYVQRGLLAHYDGIDNQATGTHDASAMTWKDVTGKAPDFTVAAGKGDFSTHPNALWCSTSRSAGYVATSPNVSIADGNPFFLSMTHEFALKCENGSAKDSFRDVFRGDHYGAKPVKGYSCFRLGGTDSIYSMQYTPAPVGKYDWKAGDAFTCTLVLPMFGAKVNTYANGTSVCDYSGDGNPAWYSGDATPLIGGQSASATANLFKGDMYAMRFYSVELAEDEVKYNAHLDQARFNFGGSAHVLGYPAEYGAPTPAYGSFDPDGDTVTFSVGTLEDLATGVRGVTVRDGVRAKFLGYSLGESTTVASTAESVEISVANGMAVVWRWQLQYRVTVDGGAAEWVDADANKTLTAGSGVVAFSGLPSSATWNGSAATFKVTRECALKSITATGNVLRWLGTSSASAANAANWVNVATSANACPASGDTVLLDATSAAQPMTWDLDDVTLQHWIQDGYTGTITFQTGRTFVKGKTTLAAYGVLMDDAETKCLKLTGSAVVMSGRWTHTATPNASLAKADSVCADGKGVWRIVADIAGDLSIGLGAQLNADALGYAKDKGPAGAGCHGGMYGTTESLGYGNPKRPQTLGTQTAATGAYGGGNIELHVTGATTVDGEIRAQGADVADAYGGAGGGVWLTTGSLRGSGRFSVKAGSQARLYSGGGGRLAVWLTGAGEDFSRYTGEMTAIDNGYDVGYGGTIYKQVATDNGKGVLTVQGASPLPLGANIPTIAVVDNRDGGTVVGMTDENDVGFRRLELIGFVRAVVLAGWVLKVDEIVPMNTTKNRAVVALKGGLIELSGDWTPARLSLRATTAGGGIKLGPDGDGLLKVTGDATFYFDKDFELWGDLEVANGGTISDRATNSSGGDDSFAVSPTVHGDVDVKSGGKINVNGTGYIKQKGVGTPTVEGKTARGATHGGAAYDVGGIKTYGSLRCPVTLGSGGNAYPGGGAVRMTVDGTLNVSGSITADGSGGGVGAGAGGSVWLVAANLTGAGTISANGGNGNTLAKGAGAGGGGRIAITLTDPTKTFATSFSGKVVARGGTCSSQLEAANGTVYIRDGGVAANDGRLVIGSDVSTVMHAVPTEISTDVTDTEVGSVEINSATSLSVCRDASLTVHGDFLNNTGVELAVGEVAVGESTGGQVRFTDATKVSVITGQTDFAELIVATPEKQLKFGTVGSCLGILAGGVFRVTGEEGELVSLRSVTDGTQWPLKLNGTADITYADIKDSDASSGAQVTVEKAKNTDSGNNANWSFISSIEPGEEIRWTGAVSDSFTDGGNWNPSRAPVETDVIIIEANKDHMPVLAAPLVCHKLKIEENASLTLGGFNLTVTNGEGVVSIDPALDCAGTIDASSGASQISLTGQVKLKHFSCGNSVVTLAGGNTSVDFGEQTLKNLRIDASVTFDSGFTAERVTSLTTVSRTLTFRSGSTVAVTYLTLDGMSGDSAMLTLRCAVAGTAWKIAVASKSVVRGVVVSDSQSLNGKIYAETPSTDNGGNADWVFGTGRATWIGGGADDLWTTAENWEGGKLPSAADRALFNAAATVTLPPEGTAVRQLEIDSAGGVVTLQADINDAPLTVSEMLDVLDGGILNLKGAKIAATLDAVVRNGGTITHPSNDVKTDQGYGVCLTVGHDLIVEQGGSITTVGKGYTIDNSGPGGARCAGHGGRTLYSDAQTIGSCYGSVYHPADLGSAGYGDSDGGGRVRLVVGGTLTASGTISSSAPVCGVYGGSGGSVWITCGALAGSGQITALGGYFTGTIGPGSGGRIAIYQTEATDFTGFTGTVRAWGGGPNNLANPPTVMCGTIYLQSAGMAEGGGTLRLENGDNPLIYVGGCVELPVTNHVGDVSQPDDQRLYSRMTLDIGSASVLRLTQDVRVNEVELAAGGKITLNGHKLIINSRLHRSQDKTKVDAQGNRKGDWPGTVDYSVPGSTIEWARHGAMVILR